MPDLEQDLKRSHGTDEDMPVLAMIRKEREIRYERKDSIHEVLDRTRFLSLPSASLLLRIIVLWTDASLGSTLVCSSSHGHMPLEKKLSTPVTSTERSRTPRKRTFMTRRGR